MQIDVVEWEGSYILLSPDRYRLSTIVATALGDFNLLWSGLKEYNGRIKSNGYVMSFKTIEDAEKAKDWVESLLVAHILAGGKV
jgi:hypothetical protein